MYYKNELLVYIKILLCFLYKNTVHSIQQEYILYTILLIVHTYVYKIYIQYTAHHKVYILYILHQIIGHMYKYTYTWY